MKTFAFILSALVASASAFAPSSSFSGNAMKTGVTSDSALSMAMEQSYIMVSIEYRVYSIMPIWYVWMKGKSLLLLYYNHSLICLSNYPPLILSSH